MKSVFARIVDVSIALSCVTVAGLLIEQRFFPEAPSVAKPPSSQLEGRRLEAIPGLTFADARQTLLIVTRSTCRYCEDSVPFWKRLVESQRADTASLRIVAVADEPIETSREYLRRHGLAIDNVVSARVPTGGTPTLILVDSQGVARKVWLGMIADARTQDEIVRIVVGST
jgi:hypothetical protein